MKKILSAFRFAFSSIVVFVILTLSFIYFYSNQIKLIVINELDRYLKEEVTMHIEKVDLTWWEHFPDISLELYDVSIRQDREGQIDTLFALKHLGFGLDISELLQNDITVEKIFLEEGQVSVRTFKSKETNYSIFKPRELDTTVNNVGFDMESLEIEDVRFIYEDLAARDYYAIYFDDNSFEVFYKDNLLKCLAKGELQVIDVTIGGDQFVHEKPLLVDLKIDYDEEKGEVILGESFLKINGGAFDFSGRYAYRADQYLDLNFNASKSDIASVTSLLPQKLASKFDKYQTEGDVYFRGQIVGDLKYGAPKVVVDFGFDDASFFAPKTNQRIEHAYLKGGFTNGEQRNASTSELQVEKFEFKLQKGQAAGRFLYSNFHQPYLDLLVEADMSFADLVSVLGVESVKNTTGNLEGKVTIKAPLDVLLSNPTSSQVVSKGEMKIKNVGFNIDKTDFRCKDINGHFLINKTDLGIIDFRGEMGASDFQIDGIAHRFIPFLLVPDESIHLQGTIQSNKVDLDQLLSQNIVQDSAINDVDQEQLYNFKISPYLAFDLSCEFDEIKFRRLKGDKVLKKVVGDLHLKDQYFEFTELDYDLAEGKFQSNGYINAKKENDVRIFAECELKELNVSELFYVFENFNQGFITDKELKGTLSGRYDISMNFDRALRLDLDKLVVNAEVQIGYGELNNFSPLMEMGKYLTKKKYKKYVKNTDLGRVKFSELNASVHVRNKEIFIPETVIKNSVSEFTLGGKHTFDNHIDYTISLPLVNYDKHGDEDIDKSKHLNIAMKIAGTTDDYNVDVVEKEVIRSIKSVIVETFRKDDENSDEIELDLGSEDDMIELE